MNNQISSYLIGTTSTTATTTSSTTTSTTTTREFTFSVLYFIQTVREHNSRGLWMTRHYAGKSTMKWFRLLSSRFYNWIVQEEIQWTLKLRNSFFIKIIYQMIALDCYTNILRERKKTCEWRIWHCVRIFFAYMNGMWQFHIHNTSVLPIFEPVWVSSTL